MIYLQRTYHSLNLLSIDVCLGAWSMGNVAADLLEVALPLVWKWMFPLSIWIIYTCDHLLDAYQLQSRAISPRHKFHVQHFKKLTFAVCVGIALILIYLKNLPASIFSLGMAMGAGVILHFVWIYWRKNKLSFWFFKEISVAGIYSLGVWGTAFVLCENTIPLNAWAGFVIFWGLALTNLLYFAFAEREQDELQAQASWIRAVATPTAQKLLYGLVIGIAILLVIFGLIFPQQTGLWAIFMGINLGNGLILHFKTYFFQNERYRKIGDALFLLPILYLC